MSEKQKSQRGFVAVTLITILAIAAVLVVYATLLGTFTGEEVVYGAGLDGQVMYSRGNLSAASNWTNTIEVPSGGAWYALLNITSTDGYIGNVNVTFQLQFQQNSTDVGSATVASIKVNGTASERIYVTTDGSGPAANRNWQTDCTAGYSYCVKATVVTDES
jgi:hypothetical protein